MNQWLSFLNELLISFFINCNLWDFIVLTLRLIKLEKEQFFKQGRPGINETNSIVINFDQCALTKQPETETKTTLE
jgi:hypothetical protein